MEGGKGRGSSSRSSSSSSSDQDQKLNSEEENMELRRGPWTVEEDLTLMNYITLHGEGRWNSLARCAGLNRTGKSCRLRWLNYLRPDVRRGNISLEEQLLILELHSRWGNRWSKIAQYLPGRTDNEIKNYWRTRVQKHAKQLKCDVNSKQFKDTMRYLWMPRLAERIQAAASDIPAAASTAALHPEIGASTAVGGGGGDSAVHNRISGYPVYGYGTPENCSSTGASSGSLGTQMSPVSDLTDYYNVYPVPFTHVPTNPDMDYLIQGGAQNDLVMMNNDDHYSNSLPNPCDYPNNHEIGNFESVQQSLNQWFDPENPSGNVDNLWNAEDIWFIQQQFNNNSL